MQLYVASGPWSIGSIAFNALKLFELGQLSSSDTLGAIGRIKPSLRAYVPTALIQARYALDGDTIGFVWSGDSRRLRDTAEILAHRRQRIHVSFVICRDCHLTNPSHSHQSMYPHPAHILPSRSPDTAFRPPS